MAPKHTKGLVKRDAIAVMYEYVEAILMAMLLLVVLFTFCFRVAGVIGDSMEPNLSGGDRLILQTHVNELAYGEIVVVNRYTEEPLIKRVIGKAGDTILIEEKTGNVYRNGILLEESYIDGITEPKGLSGEVTVPAGCLFVMGDNRGVSKDSRSEEIGMVSEHDVVGKAILRIWPFKSFGWIS